MPLYKIVTRSKVEAEDPEVSPFQNNLLEIEINISKD